VLMISGPEGPLEANYHCSPMDPKAPMVILMSPHPGQEGTMEHVVIQSLFRVFARLEFNILRFNFRGSGKSHGTFTNGEGEVSDAAACLDWMQNKNPNPSQCWVAGFSFGAYIALQLLMRRPECHSFVAVSPLANMYDFNFLAPCPAPGLVVHGEMDDVTPKESVIRLVHQLSMQKRGHKIALNLIQGADHTYSNHLRIMEAGIQEYVLSKMSPGIIPLEKILAPQVQTALAG
jgi:alpha/beta superfamily hydrolase